mmetsp:Transcript_84452/g.167655  ORF Transcript_84452/g.167655 Transcript_84452/m.167655 type:complete len:260 (+) Transcript_84452:1205-1984(+)
MAVQVPSFSMLALMRGVLLLWLVNMGQSLCTNCPMVWSSAGVSWSGTLIPSHLGRQRAKLQMTVTPLTNQQLRSHPRPRKKKRRKAKLPWLTVTRVTLQVMTLPTGTGAERKTRRGMPKKKRVGSSRQTTTIRETGGRRKTRPKTRRSRRRRIVTRAEAAIETGTAGTRRKKRSAKMPKRDLRAPPETERRTKRVDPLACPRKKRRNVLEATLPRQEIPRSERRTLATSRRPHLKRRKWTIKRWREACFAGISQRQMLN